MDTVRVYISFDLAHDEGRRDEVIALSRAAHPALTFSLLTADEYFQSPVSSAKAVRSQYIHGATHTLVLIGSNANKFHDNHKEIASRNWQWWEIEESDRCAKGLIAFRIEPGAALPNVLYGKHPVWAKALTPEDILAAINRTFAPV